MLWALPLLPITGGAVAWAAGAALARAGRPPRRLLGGLALITLGALAGLSLWVFAAAPAGVSSAAAPAGVSSRVAWAPGITLALVLGPLPGSRLVGVMIVLIPAIAIPVVLWAAAHEEARGLPRLIGLLLWFAGAMELLVLAADLLVLITGWELVGAVSWALIGHHARAGEATRSAVYAFNATRLGGLGLVLAAGAALAVTGSFAFDRLPAVTASPWGGPFAAGVLLAAASKSAQVPFSPWLFRAMAGPSSVSALLHSATMVAAGAWLLIRLHEPLSLVSWFAPVTIALGLVTAWAGAVVACVQPHAKRLLAASTSAQHGLMFAAVGAGAASAALAHLVAHAAFKALLFLASGVASAVTGSGDLDRMGLGRVLPWTDRIALVGALALAGIPPLGGAWTKHEVVAGTGQVSPWLAVVAMGAGVLGAWYSARSHLLTFGPRNRGAGEHDSGYRPGPSEHLAMAALAVLSLLLSVLWLPGVAAAIADALRISWPEGKMWESIASISAAVIAVALAYACYRSPRGRGLLRGVRADLGERQGARAQAADWLGLPAVIDRLVSAPTMALARACARFDDRVVDRGVRASAALARALSRSASRDSEGAITAGVHALVIASLRAAGATRVADDQGIERAIQGLGGSMRHAGSQARRVQSGALPTYYRLIAAGLLTLAMLAWLWR